MEEWRCPQCGDIVRARLPMCPGCGFKQSDIGKEIIFIPPKKNPAVAAVLSLLIVGIGQMYVGQVTRGMVFLVFCIVMNAFLVAPMFGGMGSLVFGLLCNIMTAIDAHKQARMFNAEHDKSRKRFSTT